MEITGLQSKKQNTIYRKLQNVLISGRLRHAQLTLVTFAKEKSAPLRSASDRSAPDLRERVRHFISTEDKFLSPGKDCQWACSCNDPFFFSFVCLGAGGGGGALN